MYKPEHVAAWQRIVDFVHGTAPAKIGMQLAHAGRKGSTQRAVGGHRRAAAGRATGRSSRASRDALLPAQPGAARDGPRATWTACATTSCAPRAWPSEAGFDLLELHFAHGYLLASFLSPLTNRRTRRLRRLAREAACASRWRCSTRCARRGRRHKPISVRISATDWAPGGLDGRRRASRSRARCAAHGCDIIDVSTGQTVPDAAAGLRAPLPDAVRRPDPPRGATSPR